MIQFNQIEKSYTTKQGKHEVLRDISFKIPLKAAVGVVGMSGSGKSTLANILLGFEKPTKGSITIEGVDYLAWIHDTKGRMSVVFQNYLSSVNPIFTVNEIITEPLSGKNKATKERLVLEILKDLDLSTSLLNRYPHQLSGGQLQRVCIARALITEPTYLVFDEILSALDVSVQNEIVLLLNRLRDKYNFGCLFIGHDIQTVCGVCEQIVVLNQGCIETIEAIHDLGQTQNTYLSMLLNSTLLLEE